MQRILFKNEQGVTDIEALYVHKVVGDPAGNPTHAIIKESASGYVTCYLCRNAREAMKRAQRIVYDEVARPVRQPITLKVVWEPSVPKD